MNNGDTIMKRIAKATLALTALLAVSACAQPNSQAQVFQDYDYAPDYNSYGYNTASAPAESNAFKMNNYY